MRFRKFGFALVVALVAAFAVAAAPAFADESTPDGNAAQLPSQGTNPDPQTTNIPYVGWLGNQLKVAKCLRWDKDTTPSDIAAAQATLGVSVSFPGRFQVEDWTGVDENNAGPKWNNGDVGDGGTTVPVEISESGICWSAHVSSNKPGMAVIKLAVSAEVLASLELRFGGLLLDIGPVAIYRDVLLKHQFLAIWLQSQTPAINEVAANQPGGNLEDGVPVGDPTGNGVFQPPFDKDVYGPIEEVFGVVKAQVKGTFPYGNDFAGQFKPVVTLPDDWKALAERLAVDDTSALGGAPGSASMRWDIHDNRLSHALGGNDAAFHSKTASCNTGVLVGKDAVDNCWSGSQTGPFSRVNGATWWTVGPFDALFPDQTLLNDGVLDADDAPMPPIRVDFAVSAGSIGAFAKADKDDVYDADNTDDQAHDLYAPFYKSYIPAAGLGGRDGGSGVAGSFANNYPGFLDDGKYDFWSTYSQAYQEGYNNCKDPNGTPYPIPTGDRQVSVYTDEHGEAFVKFLPYVGLYLQNDSQYRCNVKPGLYGEADIQATAHYPDQQPLWDGSKKSNTLRKVAYQLANKTLVCIKKPSTESEAFCVETVVDFNGDPIAGVWVRLSSSGNNAQLDAASTDLIPPYNTIGQGQGDKDLAGRWIELQTNKYGQVGIDVLSSDACVDVTSQNLETKWNDYDESGIFGSSVSLTYKVDPATGLACGTATENPTAVVGLGLTPLAPVVDPPVVDPPAGGGSGSGSGAGAPAATSTTSTVVSLGGPIIQAQPVLSATKTAVVAQSSAKLFSVKVLQTKLGRYLVVNVKGKARLAKIRIQIMGKNGKVLKTLVRTVPTNRSFKIANYKLAKTAVAVKATVTA